METKGISKLDLKRRNRKQILLAIREAGRLARVDIAAQLSLTRAAVTIITNQMIAQGILEDMNTPLPEAPDAPKKKGRKKTMIRINPTYKHVLGAVINEDSICVGLSTLAGDVKRSDIMQIDENTGQEEIVQFIVKSCNDFMKKEKLTTKQMLGLGIGVAPVRWKQFRAEITENEVTFAKLCYLLEIELTIPVCAANTITLYALANINHSNMTGRNQLLIYSGETYHASLIVEKAVIGGYTCDTTAVSRLVLVPNGEKCEGYPDGSVHAELTRAALLKKVAAVKGKEMTIDEVNVAYDAGDVQIRTILDDAVNKMAYLIYNLATLENAGFVTLQNFRLAVQAAEALRAKVAALAGSPDAIRVEFSKITAERAFLAGSSLAVEKQFFDLGGLQPSETV